MTKRADQRPIWTIDAETDPFKYNRIPKPFIWGVYTGTSFHHFAEISELVEFIKDQDVICMAHNGGKFDFHFLLAAINLAVPIKVINGRLVSAHIGKAEIRDSWNLLPVPLRDLGSKLDMDYALMEAGERNKPSVRKRIIEYLRADCIVLWEAVTRFEAQYGRYLTQASACLAQWKQISGLEAPKSDREFYDKFADFYYGGRTQVFRKGHTHGPLKVLDINSAYPWAMLDSHPYWTDHVTVANPSAIAATSMVTLDCISDGALPWRTDHGATIFPSDNERRRYYVPGHEVLAGLETFSIRDVEYIERIDFLSLVSFRPYVEHFWNLRKYATGAERVFLKLLLVSLYGKFAANPDNYGQYMAVAMAAMNYYKDEGYEFDGMLGPHALLRADLEDYQSNYFNVATAASITSQVRAKLWRAMKSATDLCYCDTDSLFCRSADVEIGNDLGEWKDEGTIDDLWIAGKKLYVALGDFGKDKSGKPIVEKKASKGVKASRAKIILASQGKRVRVYNSAPTFRIQKPPMFQKRTITAT